MQTIVIYSRWLKREIIIYITSSIVGMANVSNGSSQPENNNTENVFVVDFRMYYRYGFEFILYGYFMPIWTVLNIIIYSTMIHVFAKKGLTSKTHVCLIALAISDCVAPVFPSVFWFYFFVVKKEFYYVPFEWCRPFHYLTEVIPRIFTYMSYFLTITLAVQRYIVIAYPFKADILCSKNMTYIMITASLLSSVIVRLIHFFHYSYIKYQIQRFDNNITEEICAFGDPDWLDVEFSRYSAILQTTHTIIVNLIPCTVLVVVECLMVKAVKTHSASRKNLNLNSTMISKIERNERRLTCTTIAVTAVLLLYKIPAVIIQILDILRTMFGVQLVRNAFDLWTTNVVLNIFYWICTPSNFVITCCLSQDFRVGLRDVFRRSKSKEGSNVTLQNTTSLSSDTMSTSV